MSYIFTSELYEAYYTRFYAKALSIVQEPEAAQDIVHDAFLELLESEISFNSKEHCKAFLLKCISFRAIDFLRKKQRLIYPEVLPAVEDNSSFESVHQALYQPLLEQLAVKVQLNEKEVQLLTLMLDGYKSSQIAEKLVLEVRQIVNQKFRLLDKLRKRLGAKIPADMR